MVRPVIGALALQGAFREHIRAFERLGARAKEIRQLKDLDGIDGVVLPGGESTTIGKLLVDLEILNPLIEKIKAGMPVFGTCAGLILLCEDIEDSSQPRIGLLKARVKRNAFGSQVDSFEEFLPIPELGAIPYPAVFIRAPLITRVAPEIRVLASVTQGEATQTVACRQDNILATSFHPELTNDARFHEYFLKMVRSEA